MMPMEVEINFAGDHPSGAGHFPENPVIPGALILDEVIATLPDGAAGIRSAKFLHPVRPGETLRVRWTEAASAAVKKFECRLAGGALVASGIVEIGHPPA
jgi:3-hydroxymyristoyl/3-hydroxydecanoyl-(acyl carrier protein) dehydratase